MSNLHNNNDPLVEEIPRKSPVAEISEVSVFIGLIFSLYSFALVTYVVKYEMFGFVVHHNLIRVKSYSNLLGL